MSRHGAIVAGVVDSCSEARDGRLRALVKLTGQGYAGSYAFVLTPDALPKGRKVSVVDRGFDDWTFAPRPA